MILVLVGEEDGRERPGIDTRRLDPLRQVAGPETGVDEDPDGTALDEGGVARTARPKDTKTH
jgi:hypothetical protein